MQQDAFRGPVVVEPATLPRSSDRVVSYTSQAGALVGLLMSGAVIEPRLIELPDAALPRIREAVLTAMREHTEAFRALDAALQNETARRLTQRGAKALPDPEFEVALEEQWTPYAYDVDAAIEAADLLPDDEAAKVVRFIPERVTVEPAHHEVGSPVSINALIKKYAGSAVEAKLRRSLSRQSLEPKLVMRRRKGAVAAAEVVG